MTSSDLRNPKSEPPSCLFEAAAKHRTPKLKSSIKLEDSPQQDLRLSPSGTAFAAEAEQDVERDLHKRLRCWPCAGLR